MFDEKPTNPKDALGADKLPLHLWPNTATAIGCLGMLNGLCKYGRSNFRAIGIRASIYYDAAKRHLDAWFEGEERDPVDGVPHLGAALACIAIIVDAMAAEKLNDDRMFPGGYRKFIDSLTPEVARLKKFYEGRNPKHYTIQDAQQTRNDVHTQRAPASAGSSIYGEDGQSLSKGDSGCVVFGSAPGPVGRVQVRPPAATGYHRNHAGAFSASAKVDTGEIA